MTWNIPDRPADLELDVAGIPPSKKNGQRILRARGRHFVKASAECVAFEQRLRLLVAGIRSLGENYIAARITVDEAANRTRIEVWDLGPQPKRGPRHTRRDVHNCADAVMDALQRLAFDDDRQARIVVTRHGDVTG